MDPRRTQEQIGLFQSFTPDRTAIDIDRIRAAAMQARDEAIARALRGAFRRIGQALAAIGSALVSWPQRRSTYESLRGLTDRQLADIGLARGDIFRVFEPEFRLNTASAANSNERAAAPRAA